MANIIVVDDHALFRLGVKTALSLSKDRHCVIGEAATGEELFALLENTLPDLLLLDIILPDVHGDAIAIRVKREYPDVRILMLSSETNEETILKLVEIGIEGFISKDGALNDLQDAISTILAGDQFFGSRISMILNDLIYNRKRDEGEEHSVSFSERERMIIELCCQGLPTKVISAQLNISPRTVETHKSNIFHKLGINNLVELVRYAFQHGLIKL